MKTTPRLLFAVLVTATSHLLAETPANTTTARILGGLPDGTPPPPEAPKPGFTVKPADVLSSKAQQQGGRTLTLGEIKPIALPAPLKPTLPAPTNSAVQERFKALRQGHQETSLLLVGATISHLPDGSVRSLVTFQPLGIGEPVTFASSADFGLLAGIRSFIDSAGKTHDLLMSWSVEPNELPSTPATRFQRNNDLKKLPKLPPGPATYAVISGNPDPSTLTAIQSLHALYQSEQPRLLAAHQGRERTRLQEEAELKAHPPRPKDLVLHHWTIGKSTPAPVEGGTK